MNYTYDRRISNERPKYPDGRLIPQPGDIVYQVVRAMFGSAGYIEGVVSRSGKTVKITGGGAMIGYAPIGKTVRISPAWTVKDDPAIKAREDEKKRKEAEEAALRAEEKKIAEAAVAREAAHRGLHRVRSVHELKPGDTVFYIVSAYGYEHEDPHKVYVEPFKVHEVKSSYFTYLNEHGDELTSGNVDTYWKKP